MKPGSRKIVHDELVLTVQADCLLRGYSPELLAALRQQLTIDNPRYRDARKYGRWVGKQIKPQLHFFNEEADGLRFPRGFARVAVGLCRQHLGQAPRIEDQRRVLTEQDFRFHGELRPYQLSAVDAVLAHQFGVLVAGTGSGKTVMALKIIAERRQPTLILLHSKELLYQWRDRIRQFLELEAGLLGDGHFDIRPVTIAIVNTARRHLAELPAHFGQLIVDECHRVPASLFTGVVAAFDCRFMLGLSATAYRRDDGLTRLIYYYMGDKVHEVDQGELTASGAVLKPKYIQRPTGFSFAFRGDYQALMTALTADEARNRQIADDIISATREKGTLLVVSDRVAHCERLAALLAERGLESKLLTGRAGAEQRAAIVEAVRGGEVKVLISTLQLVGEGFDAAGLTTLFLTTPIKFSGRLRQVIGRILRPAAGKQPRVIDYLDVRVGVLRTSARARLRLYSDQTGLTGLTGKENKGEKGIASTALKNLATKV